MLAPFAISVLIYDQDALLARSSSARALLEQQFEAALVNLPRVPPRLRKEPLQALRFPSLGSDHRLGVRKGGEGLVAFGGQQEPLKIASETFTLGASVKEIVKACCVLFQRTGSGLYGQSSGHGGISFLCATIGAQRFSYFNKVPVGCRESYRTARFHRRKRPTTPMRTANQRVLKRITRVRAAEVPAESPATATNIPAILASAAPLPPGSMLRLPATKLTT